MMPFATTHKRRRRAALPALIALLAGPALSGAPAPAAANEFAGEMAAAFDDAVRPWLDAPAVVDALRAANAAHADLAAAEIAALDARWQGEVDAGGGALVARVMDAPVSDFLRARAAETGDLVTEVFVMDSRGLTVGANAPTSDYMQGDEAKWTRTFEVGPEAVHVGDLEFDPSTETYQAQYSATIVDPATGDPIGAITVGMRIEALL